MKGLSFSEPMVKAWMAGNKTVTRRLMNPQPDIIYGLTGDSIYAIHTQNANRRQVYGRNNLGEWCCSGPDSGVTKCGLYGWQRRECVLPDKVCRIWEKGFRGLVSAVRVQGQTGDIQKRDALPQQQENDKECPYVNLHVFPRDKTEYVSSSTAPRREPGKQPSEKFSVGNTGRELDGSKNTRTRNRGRGSSELEAIELREKSRSLDTFERAGQSKRNSEGLGSESTIHCQMCKWKVGDIVYIKETWRETWCSGSPDKGYEVGLEYRAKIGDGYGKTVKVPEMHYGYKLTKKGKASWKSPRFMPEYASRSHALIVSVRPERIKEITVEEAIREGIQSIRNWETPLGAIGNFAKLWESLHPGSWERNDWVWRIELEKKP